MSQFRPDRRICVGLKFIPPPHNRQSRCSRPYKAHWRHKSQAVLFIFPPPALPTLHIVQLRFTSCSALGTTCPFRRENSHLVRLRAAAGVTGRAGEPHGSPQIRRRGEQPVRRPRPKPLVPANDATHHEPNCPRARRPREPRNKGPAHFRNPILNTCAARCERLSGYKQTRPMTFAGIS